MRIYFSIFFFLIGSFFTIKSQVYEFNTLSSYKVNGEIRNGVEDYLTNSKNEDDLIGFSRDYNGKLTAHLIDQKNQLIHFFDVNDSDGLLSSKDFVYNHTYKENNSKKRFFDFSLLKTEDIMETYVITEYTNQNKKKKVQECIFTFKVVNDGEESEVNIPLMAKLFDASTFFDAIKIPKNRKLLSGENITHKNSIQFKQKTEVNIILKVDPAHLVFNRH